ncbi:MAG: hypothetical protein WC352_03025 [Candidatus Omnitrophota bacterium]
MKNLPREEGKERGFILITTYLIIFVLTVFSAALFWRHMTFMNSVERNKNRIVAFNMAEAGLDQTIARLQDTTNFPNYPGTNGDVMLNSASADGGYNVVVCPPACTGLVQPGGDVRLVRAVGFAPTSTAGDRAQESRIIQSYVNLVSTGLFQNAVFAKSQIVMSGNASTDAFDSAVADYGIAPTIVDGDIRTNGTSAGAITLSGNNVRINGDAMIGPGGNVDTAIVGGSLDEKILGQKTTAPETIDYVAKTTDVVYTNLILDAEDPTPIAGGTYRLQSLDLTGKESLVPTGAVTLYVDGPVKLTGQSIATVNNRPRNLVIYVTTNANVSISGDGDFYGAIYAPLSEISNTGKGAVYGSVIGDSYKQSGNGAVHFDVDMRRVEGGPTQTVQVWSWQEENPTVSA